jgi:L-2-hydroxycarboxylate dehydrogenase (NAD+)
MLVPLDELRRLNRRALTLAGYEEDEINLMLDILWYAQLRGNIQSIVQFAGPGMPKHPEAGDPSVIKETALSVLLDGNRNAGMVVMHRAMILALEKAAAQGFGMVGTRNTCQATAAIGYYVRHLALNGFIGLAFSGSSKKVAHFGSYQPIYGTNPLAVGLPTLDEPIVLDMATSALPLFKLAAATMLGKPLPVGVAMDAAGQETIDPQAALSGALRSMDRSPKGSGLGLLAEALTGPLVGAAFANVGDTEHNWGNLILAIDPELLVGRGEFQRQMSALHQALKSCSRLPGVQEIFLPGEQSGRRAAAALQSGYLEIDDQLFGRFREKITGL